MRRTIWIASLAAITLIPAAVWCQQADQKQDASQGQTAASSTSNQPQTPATPQQDSLAAAARRSREQKKDSPKAAKVFDNDSIPTHGGVSAVGSDSNSTAAGNTANAQGTGATTSAGSGEKAWRDKFATLRHKLEQDQAELDVMQRELAVLNMQDYSDPTKGMQQGLTRSDINDKTSAIEAKKKQIDADQQAISDAEDDLRKAGGEPGWAR